MSNDTSKPVIPAAAAITERWWVAPLSVFAMVILFYMAQVIGGLVVSVYPALHHWTMAETDIWLTNSVPAQFTYGLLADGLIILGVAVMLKILRWKWATIGLTRLKFRYVAYGLMAAIPYYVLYIVIVTVVSMLVPSLNINQKQDIGFTSVHGAVSFCLAFISLVVLPPLAEEIMMRGFLYTGLRKWLPRILAALIVSALFGAAHLAEGGDAGPLWIGAIDTFTLSLVLVFLRERTGSLWSGITLHAVKNSIAFFAIFIVGLR